jgi:hypothetical protein
VLQLLELENDPTHPCQVRREDWRSPDQTVDAYRGGLHVVATDHTCHAMPTAGPELRKEILAA